MHGLARGPHTKGHGAVCPAETQLATGVAHATVNNQSFTADLSAWDVFTGGESIMNVDEHVGNTLVGGFTGRNFGHVIAFRMQVGGSTT